MERILNLKKRRYLKNTLKIALIYSKLYLTITDLEQTLNLLPVKNSQIGK